MIAFEFPSIYICTYKYELSCTIRGAWAQTSRMVICVLCKGFQVEHPNIWNSQKLKIHLGSHFKWNFTFQLQQHQEHKITPAFTNRPSRSRILSQTCFRKKKNHGFKVSKTGENYSTCIKHFHFSLLYQIMLAVWQTELI